MAELNDLQITDANNTGRFPNGMQVEQINDAARALEGMLGRWFKDATGQAASSGTSTAYTFQPYRTVTSYAAGQVYMFRAHVACGSGCTIAIAGLAAKPLRRQNGDAIVAGDIVLNQMVLAAYNASLDAFTCFGLGDSNASNGLPTYTVSTLPALTDTRMIYVSNESGGAVPAFSDGSAWRRVTDRAIVS